eukprot:1498572-Rhodomonas_salina.2
MSCPQVASRHRAKFAHCDGWHSLRACRYQELAGSCANITIPGPVQWYELGTECPVWWGCDPSQKVGTRAMLFSDGMVVPAVMLASDSVMLSPNDTAALQHSLAAAPPGIPAYARPMRAPPKHAVVLQCPVLT